jgi:hypothetical protein
MPPPCPLNRRLGGKRTWYGHFGIKNNLFPCQEWNHDASAVIPVAYSIYQLCCLSSVWYLHQLKSCRVHIATNFITMRLKYAVNTRLYSRHVKPAGRMRPFASTPAARTEDTVIWSFEGQICSFYNLNCINVRHSQKKSCFSLFRMFFTLGNDRLFPSAKITLYKEDTLYARNVVCGPHDNTNVTHMALGGLLVWHACSTAVFPNLFDDVVPLISLFISHGTPWGNHLFYLNWFTF